MTPPNSGAEVAKKPKMIETMIMANKSQNQVDLNLLNGIPKNKYNPVKKNKRTKRKEATPKPWYTIRSAT